MNCPRCQRQVFRNYDELYCFVCGTISEPQRPWDVVEVGLHTALERKPTLTELDRQILAGEVELPTEDAARH